MPDDLAADDSDADEDDADEDDAAPFSPPKALPPARPAQGFQPFEAKDARFAVKFPGQPARAQDDSSIDYEVKGDAGTCSFSVMTFAHDEEVPAVALELFVKQMAQRFGSGLTRNEATTIAGLSG